MKTKHLSAILECYEYGKPVDPANIDAGTPCLCWTGDDENPLALALFLGMTSKANGNDAQVPVFQDHQGLAGYDKFFPLPEIYNPKPSQK